MTKSEKPRVLVVDDNPETCTLLTAVLRRDFAVEIANDGSEAVEQLRHKRYSAILLDLRMPQHDGFSVLQFLEQSQPETLRSVIVVTALLSQREIARAESFKIFGVIPKPFDVETLLATVKRCASLDSPSLGGVFCSPVLILLADLLRRMGSGL